MLRILLDNRARIAQNLPEGGGDDLQTILAGYKQVSPAFRPPFLHLFRKMTKCHFSGGQ